MHERKGANESVGSTRRLGRVGLVLRLLGLGFLLIGFASCVLAMYQYG